jgi:hypothetical protein
MHYRSPDSVLGLSSALNPSSIMSSPGIKQIIKYQDFVTSDMLPSDLGVLDVIEENQENLKVDGLTMQAMDRFNDNLLMQSEDAVEHSLPMQPEDAVGHSLPMQPEDAVGHSLPMQPEDAVGHSLPMQPEDAVGHSLPMQPEDAVGHSLPMQPKDALKDKHSIQPTNPYPLNEMDIDANIPMEDEPSHTQVDDVMQLSDDENISSPKLYRQRLVHNQELARSGTLLNTSTPYRKRIPLEYRSGAISSHYRITLEVDTVIGELIDSIQRLVKCDDLVVFGRDCEGREEEIHLFGGLFDGLVALTAKVV